MRDFGVAGFCVLAGAIGLYAQNGPIDCSKKSLAVAVRDASDKNPSISFTGVCAGPIVVAIDGLTLRGVGTAVIDGGGLDAVTIGGASRVSLVDLEVRNGLAGIVAHNGAHISLTRVNSHDNSGSGIVIQSASSAVLSGVQSSNNGRVGLLADDGAAITLTDSSITGNTARDIQLTFGTRADFSTMTFGTYTCDATVLIRGTSGIVCPH